MSLYTFILQSTQKLLIENSMSIEKDKVYKNRIHILYIIKCIVLVWVIVAMTEYHDQWQLGEEGV